MQTATTFNYNFELSYYDNYLHNLEKSIPKAGNVYTMFMDSWLTKSTTKVVDGVVVNDGIDIKDHVQRVYNGQTPECLLDAIGHKIAAASTKIFGCEFGKAIYAIIDDFTDIFGTFICTATTEYLGRECAASFLQVLKDYRDSTMTDREGLLMLKYYRDIGPKIVEAISNDVDKDDVYKYLWADYISTLHTLVACNDKDKLIGVYLQMVDEMADRYNISTGKEFTDWKVKYGL